MIWVLFSSGRGPGECQIACQRLAEIFLQEARAAGAEPQLLDAVTGDHGWLSALISLDGSTEFVAGWEGTIQWTCPSPIRKGWGRKNWFISVSVLRPPSGAQQLRDADLEFQSYRSSGPGGQHVNTTNSAVRVVHRPTGLTAQAQEERSQHRNKALAVARLAAMLAAQAREAHNSAEKERWTRHDRLERGNPVRVYKGPNFKLAT